MRFMVIVKATPETEGGAMPSNELLLAMGKYNEELVKAGVMIDGAGLHPSNKGARVNFDGGKISVTDGPFAESKELVAGFWMWECKSLEEAIEWARRCPNDPNEPSSHLEIRQVFENEDFEQGSGIDQHEKVAEMLADRNAGKA
jgi:hypothetical protein